ncbi:hypothetical protein COT70_02245 [candidate division WWE3 bacterium CG09_land_8_20_14_0_10_47_33]|uniref:Uncharacterized protein n=1 Tax=candidate division WWE3 bacterium CG_4_9_14_0_2_um_filter_48_10 TaxID=1975078 RepID=A0A2M8EK40_UNCKA|nr:MAG: hypothetical protein COT70_02245 [candidate division WWE3 bacterium CG09_land_8_20_14_0_10_47_33]PIZ41062.1 MAG: hypothetical protein COY35_01155 [candidate division WWE3 bacterium CG_4_10_14_0_2_um_filter_47_8]PJC23094.1 MAG: hypothetical protein CO059_00605 [candidate division WWE3 bacterium CG_4_9_14_0_2_um_filter_48_10]PJE51937.1 MAG: hypothetical protein COV28_01330 [candidate division WWE3 bacterium CG10_big_fil_rev_8_21_14_0_10_48_23]
MDQPQKILKVLKQAKRILIPLHVNVDGDSVGSALALQLLLETWGKKVNVVSVDPVPANLLFLSRAKKIRKIDPADLDLRKYNLLLITDISNLSRLSRKEGFQLSPEIKTINIDHHPSGAEKLIDLKYVDPNASSTAELLFDLMKQWKVKLTPEIAQCLLTGIITDTGCFQYASTTPEVLEKSAELIHLGANREEIVFNIYRSWPLPVLSLWATLLNNAKLKDSILYTTLSRQEQKRLKIDHANLSTARSYAASELLRAIKGTEAAAIFTDEGEKIHVNLRSRAEFDVGKIAETLGGGGHSNSAAFDFQGKMKEAIEKTTELVERVLK